MDSELKDLHAEVDQIAKELAEARSTLRTLTTRTPRLRLFVPAMIAAGAVLSLTLFAQGNLAKTGKVTSINAPFTIVDKNGVPILRIDGAKRHIDLHNSGGARIVRLDSLAGGTVAAHEPGDDETSSELTAVLQPRLTIWNKGLRRAAMGRTLDGGGRVDVFALTRTESVAGMRTFGGAKGQIAVYNAVGFAVSHLAESDKIAGAGRITVANAQGKGVFSAGGTVAGGEFCRGRGAALECGQPDLPLSIRVSPK
jgi:hypothetical protein